MIGYYTVKGVAENTITIERSKFICSITSIDCEEDAKRFIESVDKKYPLANHHCYAYIADEMGRTFKFSDAGEPQGTAGMPIYLALKNRNFCKTIAVVTRYFGGIKLGAGGLTRAYGNCVTECLNSAEICFNKPVVFFKVTTDYDNYSNFIKFTDSSGFKRANTSFNDIVEIEFAIENNNADIAKFNSAVQDFFKGKKTATRLRDGYFDFQGEKCQK